MRWGSLAALETSRLRRPKRATSVGHQRREALALLVGEVLAGLVGERVAGAAQHGVSVRALEVRMRASTATSSSARKASGSAGHGVPSSASQADRCSSSALPVTLK